MDLDKEDFKDLLECPVCFETIDSVPIDQCRNGHVVCKNCHPKLETCPICRELREGPIHKPKLENMGKTLQLSISEATEKLTSESIEIGKIEPEIPNVCLDTNQETSQATVELNIVEDDENVTIEFGPSQWIGIFFLIGFGLFGMWKFFSAIVNLFILGTTESVLFGCISVLLVALICLATYKMQEKNR